MARQKEEVGRPFTVRIRSAQLAELEAWMAREGEAGLSHQKAILRLVTAGMHDVTKISDATKERDGLAKLEVDILTKELAELRAENADLGCQLAERTDPRAQLSLLNNLSPASRAEFERMRPSLAGETDAEKLATLIEKALRVTASGYAARQAKQAEAPTVTTAPTPVMVPDPAPSHDHSPSRDAFADLDEQLAPPDDLADPTLSEARSPEIESEEDFFARMKSIRDDPNKTPAQIQREQKAELEAREAKRRDRDRASKNKLTPAEIEEILALFNEP